MKLLLFGLASAAFICHTTAWSFAFSDDPGCSFAHDGASGDGSKSCENIEAGDDTDHAQVDDLNGCIVTLYEQNDCPADGDGDLDAIDEGESCNFQDVARF